MVDDREVFAILCKTAPSSRSEKCMNLAAAPGDVKKRGLTTRLILLGLSCR